MGDIYRHCHVNIAASASKNSEGGLFFDRNPLLVQPLRVYTCFPFNDPGQKVMCHNIVFQKPCWKNVQEAPLNTRGWVMQERLLSLRILHCTTKQLCWECNKTIACESYPDSTRTSLGRDSKGLDSKPVGYLPWLHLRPATDNSYIAWFALVQEYSTYKLTEMRIS
jgi:hypothetical protein